MTAHILLRQSTPLHLCILLVVACMFFTLPALVHAEDATDVQRVDGVLDDSDTVEAPEEQTTSEREQLTEDQIRDRLQDIRAFESDDATRVHDGDENTDWRTEIEARIEAQRQEAEDRVNARRAEFEEKRAEMEEHRAERHAELTEHAKERIKAYIERVENRFMAAIDRLERLSERILSRIEKFEERGVNMDEPRRLLGVAVSEIDTAREAVRLFIAEVSTVTDADDPKSDFERVRELATIAKNSIKDAHSALVEAIRAIKAADPNREKDEENDEDEDDNTSDETDTSSSSDLTQ